jgi:hypothetical protein
VDSVRWGSTNEFSESTNGKVHFSTSDLLLSSELWLLTSLLAPFRAATSLSVSERDDPLKTPS